MLQAPVNMLGILPLLCRMGMGHTLLRLVPQLHHISVLSSPKSKIHVSRGFAATHTAERPTAIPSLDARPFYATLPKKGLVLTK